MIVAIASGKGGTCSFSTVRSKNPTATSSWNPPLALRNLGENNMDPSTYPPDLNDAIRFHGHLCPGLAIGYHAAKIAMERLDVQRAEDEELIAIVENDSCSVDGVQWVTGCTFGKGNLFFKDYGKQAFTFAVRPSGRAVRVVLRPHDKCPAVPDGDRDAKIDLLLNAPADSVFDIDDIVIDLPNAASIHDSIVCERCGEATMSTRTHLVYGKAFCLACAEAARSGKEAGQ